MDSIYQQDQHEPFEKLFKAPGALYRDTPFWAWNCRLEEKQLREQIGIFQEMGMGGFHMHSRTGMGTPYLSEEFFDRVKECVDEAKKRNMLAWLYDEDRWPSGSAGGIVTKNPAMRARYLEIHFQPMDIKPDKALDNSGTLLKCYLVKLDENGLLAEYKCCGADDAASAGFKKIWCYLIVAANNEWYNDQAYVDTLNPKAIGEFVRVTHDAYHAHIGEEFDKTVPAIFTDEPQFFAKMPLNFAAEENPITLPYTNDFPETYRKAYSCEFFDTLPELIWELPDGQYSLARYRYHDHVCERFTAAFSDTVGNWCKAHGIRSTGHMMQEPTLYSQTGWLGEAMRSYRGFLLPGIDTLCDCKELSTAKQAQSASRQFGRGGVLSELDGVTDWDFDFAGHKCHGDWQAALGVTVRVPHLSWVSMAGEAKRDYPASISYQSPWHKKYSVITDHFARVATAMTRGKARCQVAVVHPIESYWLLWGPNDQTATAREQAEENFSNLFKWLLHGLIDFDLLSESLLPIQNVHVENGMLCVGEMKYKTVLVPPTITLRSTTLEIIEKFRAEGGDVIFAGDIATLCDAVPSNRPTETAAKCRRAPYARAALLQALEERRDLKVIDSFKGGNIDGLLYQMRELPNGQRLLFVVRTEHIGLQKPSRVMLKGDWDIENLDTSNGEITPADTKFAGGWTTLETIIYPHGHLLLRLTPGAHNATTAKGEVQTALWDEEEGNKAQEKLIAARIDGTAMPITLDEPNVIPLDEPEWRLDGGQWQASEEILRMHNRVRALWGLGPKSNMVVQPWVYPVSEKTYGILDMRFAIHCEVPVEGAFLALEQPEQTKIALDGTELAFSDAGYWTDACLRKTALPRLEAGEHTLTLTREYHDDTNIDRAYILGDFGVKVEDRRITAIAPVRTLHWGDIGVQGLPFYSGNVTYHTTFELPQPTTQATLRIPSRLNSLDSEIKDARLLARELNFATFKGTLLDASIDGKFAGNIAFAPYELKLGALSKGTHKLDITLYGSRYNSFGALHLTNRISWTGANAWRTYGDDFTYSYRTVPVGILCEPLVLSAEVSN